MVASKYLNPIRGLITSKFGNRIHPVTGASEFHNGVDVAAVQGTAVISPAGGIVSNVYYNSLGGNQLIIDHTEIVTGYAHLNAVLVKVGDKVTAGQKIAIVGSTGQSTGAHLHFTLRKGGNLVNPLDYFDFKS